MTDESSAWCDIEYFVTIERAFKGDRRRAINCHPARTRLKYSITPYESFVFASGAARVVRRYHHRRPCGRRGGFVIVPRVDLRPGDNAGAPHNKFAFEGRLTGAQLDRGRLGPAIIKERARIAGVHLAVDSAPGEGARVELTFSETPHG